MKSQSWMLLQYVCGVGPVFIFAELRQEHGDLVKKQCLRRILSYRFCLRRILFHKNLACGAFVSYKIFFN